MSKTAYTCTSNFCCLKNKRNLFPLFVVNFKAEIVAREDSMTLEYCEETKL